MKRRAIGCMVVLLAVVAGVQAQNSELHGTAGVSYTTRYVWRGFDIFDDHAAVHPFADIDLFGSGFGFSVMGHRAASSGFENSERWDYYPYYQNMMFDGQPYATHYRLGYVHYNYPDMSSHTDDSTDLSEVHGLFSWPDILPVDGLVPRYCLVKLWPTNSNTIVGHRSPSGGTASGWAHIFMLDYGLNMACPMTGDSRVINLHSEFIYNDGVGPNGANVDHDWSNAVLGASTDFEVADNICFTPGIFYQSSWDDSVNPESEFWASFTAALKF